MNKQSIFYLFSCLAFCFSTAHAAEEEKSMPYSYASYFQCSPASEADVDELVTTTYAKAYDEAKKEGAILGWGWLQHHTGGKWRRILYHTAADVNALLDAQEVIGEKLTKAIGDGPDALSKGCTTHEDYIWQYVTGSNPEGPADRGTASMSVYFYCDITADEKIDEIVKTTFAKVYNANVGEGKLTSWGWNTHVVGGKYRKLATMTAASYKDLLAAREVILEQLYSDKANEKPAQEFSKMCKSHSDYLWTIAKEN
ncbi:hypothetical protein E2K93_09500 [Thalassotalea sp. HSM 43]|uniref:hypothetical protein n=1 Tax=Thalassotalea sp. HSM 43 TaxID=2552945 RepID=UPI0010803D39|nr:hypothetical protein [Thalassotalea sp. HSM 43]QBY04609.1 hypothetical protein E2K93_09500 [Thalassotalea sp. HSM 43]